MGALITSTVQTVQWATVAATLLITVLLASKNVILRKSNEPLMIRNDGPISR